TRVPWNRFSLSSEVPGQGSCAECKRQIHRYLPGQFSIHACKNQCALWTICTSSPSTTIIIWLSSGNWSTRDTDSLTSGKEPDVISSRLKIRSAESDIPTVVLEMNMGGGQTDQVFTRISGSVRLTTAPTSTAGTPATASDSM